VGPTRQRGEGRGIIPLQVSPAGPRAEIRAGPDWLPGAFLFIFLSFLLFFSVFLFLL
jgi:hypothetical protein